VHVSDSVDELVEVMSCRVFIQMVSVFDKFQEVAAADTVTIVYGGMEDG
jgi:hypothetical protein